MARHDFRPLLTLLLAAAPVAAPLSAGSQASVPSLGERRLALQAKRARDGHSEPDRPDERRRWELEWFGGQASAEHMRAKAELAQREFERWGSQLPGARKAGLASVAGPAWVNLGPTANLTDASFPDVDSGRPGAIVADPTDASILYVATSGGGIYKTTDAGSSGTWTWTNITDGLPLVSSNGSIAIGAMTMSPVDHLTLFMGLGDSDGGYGAGGSAAGVGLFKTTDGGATWTACGALGSTTRTRAILVLDANTILVGGNDGLWRSTDGGTSFTRIASIGSGVDVWTIQKFDATNLVCSVQTSAGQGSIRWSNDAGVTWNTATLDASVTNLGLHRISVATAPAASATAGVGVTEDSSGGIASGLLKTTDKGHNWTFAAAPSTSGSLFLGVGNQMGTDGSQGFYNHGLAVDPSDINKVFLGSNLALYRTTDGGATWTQLTHWYANRHVYAHADFHCAAWYGAGTAGVKLYYGNDGGLAVINDPYRLNVPTAASGAVSSDTTFIDNTRNRGLTTHLIYNLGSTLATSPADSRYRISLGMQDNGTRIRQPNGGSSSLTGTETVYEDKNGGDGFGTLIHPTNGNLMLASYTNATISKSIDGGNDRFQAGVSGITEAGGSGASFVTRMCLGDAAHPDTVYAPVNLKVYKSTDFGSNFTAMGTSGLPTSSFSIRNLNASRSDANRVAVVANGGRAYVTVDGGSSWTQTGSFPGGQSSMSYIWFDTEAPTTMYAASVAVNFGANHLWKSTNGGSTWTAIDGAGAGFPFGLAVHVIQNLPGHSNVLFAGTDFGVYRSSDGGTTWARFGNGMPFVAVRDFYVAPDGSFIRAATFGRGVYELQGLTGPSVSIAPAGPVNLLPGATATFAATVTNASSDNTVSWTASAGSLSPTTTAGDGATTTTFTAPGTPQVVSVTATSNESASSSASVPVNVYNPASVGVSVSPTSKVLSAGGTATFTATVTGAPTQAVTWTLQEGSPAGGTLSSGGAYTAPSTPGTYHVKATSIWAGTGGAAVSATATVTVKSLDLNADGAVDVLDVLTLSAKYGSTAAGDLLVADLNGDGQIDDTDLQLLLAGI